MVPSIESEFEAVCKVSFGPPDSVERLVEPSASPELLSPKIGLLRVHPTNAANGTHNHTRRMVEVLLGTRPSAWHGMPTDQSVRRSER